MLTYGGTTSDVGTDGDSATAASSMLAGAAAVASPKQPAASGEAGGGQVTIAVAVASICGHALARLKTRTRSERRAAFLTAWSPIGSMQAAAVAAAGEMMAKWQKRWDALGQELASSILATTDAQTSVQHPLPFAD